MSVDTQTSISRYINSLVYAVKDGLSDITVLFQPDHWYGLSPEDNSIINDICVSEEMLPDGEIVLLYDFNSLLSSTLFGAIILDHSSLYYCSLFKDGTVSVIQQWYRDNEHEDCESHANCKEDFLNELAVLYKHQSQYTLNEIVYNKLVYEKMTPDRVVDLIVKFRDLPIQEAQNIVETEVNRIQQEGLERIDFDKKNKKNRNKEARVQGRRKIIRGISWMVGGLLATWIMQVASEALGVGWYIAFSGAVLYGFITFIRGLRDQFRW